MSFNPDPNKQAQDIIFSRKTKKICQPSLRFNNSIVSQTPHLGIFLDVRLTFEEHLKVITTKINKTKAPLRKLQTTLPRAVLMTMYKAFVRPYLDYGDIIYDEAYNEAFHEKLESFQCSACLTLSRTTRGSPREKLSHELRLESLQRRHCHKKLCLFYKIFKENKPAYLFNLIPTKIQNIIPEIQIKLLYFILNITFSKTLFFHLLLLNGTS